VVVLPGIPKILNVKMKPLAIEEVQNSKFKIQNSKLTLYPNPFSKKTDIRWQIADSRLQNADRQPSAISNQLSVSLKIYDASGRLVRQWDYQTMRLSDQVVWHGDDDLGCPVPSGVYFVQLEAENYRQTANIILLR